MAFSKMSPANSLKFLTNLRVNLNYIYARKNFGSFQLPKKRFSTATPENPAAATPKPAETPASPSPTVPPTTGATNTAANNVDKKVITNTTVPKETVVTSATSAKPSGSVTVVPKLTVREVKNTIRGRPPKFMKLWYILGLAGVGAATMYYLNEQDRHERKVEHAVKMIESKDTDIKREGLQQLDHCLFLQKKLLSVVTEIPQPKKILVDTGLVEALMNCYSEDDNTLKEGASIWLNRLVEVPEARKRITAFGIDPILYTMAAADTKSSLWLAASSVLLNLSKYDDSIPGIATHHFRNTINSMFLSEYPIAPLMAAHIEKSVLQNEEGKRIFEGARQKIELEALTNTPCSAALKAAIGAVIPPEPKPHNPPDALLNSDTFINLNTLWSPLAWGIVASMYGSIRWRLAGRIGGLSGPDLKKFVRKQNKTGSYVFFLLMLDPLAQLMLAWPEKGIRIPYISDEPIKLPKEPFGLPLTTAIPIAESTLFVAAGLFALRYQRFVLAPMVAALTSSHWDEIYEISKPVQEALGIQEDPAKVLERHVRSAVQNVIDEINKSTK